MWMFLPTSPTGSGTLLVRGESAESKGQVQPCQLPKKKSVDADVIQMRSDGWCDDWVKALSECNWCVWGVNSCRECKSYRLSTSARPLMSYSSQWDSVISPWKQVMVTALIASLTHSYLMERCPFFSFIWACRLRGDGQLMRLESTQKITLNR